jgi:plasmid maintenance system killer protein
MKKSEDETKRNIGAYKLTIIEGLNSDASLNKSALKAGLAILKCLNQDSLDTYVSQDVIAAYTGISRQSAIAGIAMLKKKKWIWIKRISGKNNRRYLYSFNMDKALEFIDAANERVIIAQEQLHERTEDGKQRQFQKRLERLEQSSHGKDLQTMEPSIHGKDLEDPWSKNAIIHGKDSQTVTPIRNYVTRTPIRLSGNDEVVIEGEDNKQQPENGPGADDNAYRRASRGTG